MEKVIVIVDDAGPVREVLQEAILQLRSGSASTGELRVETVRNGEELLERCSAASPDLVILDVNMPGMDGIETFHRLRERNPEIASRTVFLTGYAGSPEVNQRLQDALAAGARGVLLKPVGLADIEKLLQRHLR